MAERPPNDSILLRRYPRQWHPENDHIDRSLFIKSPHIVRCIEEKGETFERLYQNYREYITISWGLATERCPNNFEMLQAMTLEYEPRNDPRGDLGLAIKFFRVQMNVSRFRNIDFKLPTVEEFWEVVKNYPNGTQNLEYEQSDTHLKDRQIIISLICDAPIEFILDCAELMKTDDFQCNPQLYAIMKSDPGYIKHFMYTQRLRYAVQNYDRGNGVQWLKNQGYKPDMPRWIAKKIQNDPEFDRIRKAKHTVM